MAQTSRTERGAFLLTLALLLTFAAPKAEAESAPYFTLSTEKTFSPTEKPYIHLYTRNEAELEFRVYKVRDEEKFLAGLSEMHSFGTEELAGVGPAEDIDEKSWLERFHDWKDDLRISIRHFFRDQLSDDTRQALRERQSGSRRSRVISSAEFALVPVLNSRQLVARFRLQVPGVFVTNRQNMPMEPLAPGMYLMEATDGHLKAYTVLMVSRTALITRTTPGQVLAFVVDRVTGEPVAKADVVLAIGKDAPMRQTTGPDGVAIFTAPPRPLKPAGDNNGSDDADSSSSKQWVMSRTGGDVALVAPWFTAFTQQRTDDFTAYTYTDRPVYRPGHTVHFKSVIRNHHGDALALPALKQVHATVTDTDSKTIFEQDLPVSSFGTVESSFTLPANTALGNDSITLTGPNSGDIGRGDFLVEDYRKPEYQVRVSTAKQRVLEGDSNSATIEARYFFGEPVANARVKYRIFEQAHYWWGDPDDADENAPAFSYDQHPDDTAPAEDTAADGGATNDSYVGDQNEEKTGKLGPDGKLTVPIPTRFDPKDHSDKDIVVEAAVTDPAGREVTGRYHFLATYGSFRIHAESRSYLLRVGESAEIDITAVDYDNHPVQTPVHVLIESTRWDGGKTTRTTLGNMDTATDASGKAIIHAPINASGSIEFTVTANTPEHRTLLDTASVFVESRDADLSGMQSTAGSAILLADKKSYAPGDTAHLTLLSQVAGFHALVLSTGYTEEFRKVVSTSDPNAKTLSFEIPITTDSQPNVTVEAIFLKDGVNYHAKKSLSVPPTQKQLQITVTPARDIFQPGQAATYDVEARDYAGRPVSADLSFGVVDEAIYSLHPDTSGDMLRHFYPKREIDPDIDDSLTYYFTGEAGTRSPLLAERHSRYRPLLAQVKPGNNVVQPKVRKDFPDTASWQPSVHTDLSGHARVTLNFPDSLTTWRATVRANTVSSEFGSTINRVLVRKNIIVRMGQPRFLRKGDTVTVPVIVHNYLPDAKQITLSLEAQGVDIVSGTSQQVSVASRGEATVLYHLRASAIGTATLTAKALSTQESDALQITLPVQPNGVQQTLPDSGVLYNTADGTKTVVFPDGTDPGAHSLTVQVSPSIAGSLFSSLDYLTTFPYGCTEQTMSSFLPNIIVGQAMAQLGIPPAHSDPATFKAQLDAKVQAGVQRLIDYRHADGGWGWWKEDASQVFMTAYVVSGLAQAAKAGYPYADAGFPGIAFLQKQLSDHPRMKPELRAYVVYALAEASKLDSKQLDTLYSRKSDLSPQALAYTGLAMLDAHDTRANGIAQLLESKAITVGDLTHWTASRNELLDVDEDDAAPTTAFALKFLVHADPNSGLIPRAAQWLAAQRTQGLWWGSTQDTAFVLYGLTDFLAATHEMDADLDVQILLNNNAVAHQHFTRADVTKGAALTLTLDATKLAPQSNAVRIITKGHGRAYWSTQGQFFSTGKHAYQQGTMQLNIARDYFTLVPTTDRNNHITYDLKPLSGPVAVGDVLAIHLGVSGSPQKYLLIEDPVPAGVEFVNNVSSYNINRQPSSWDFWYTRQEFRDDRAALFATTFDGRHDSFYLVRVTNAGSFAIAPARVQPMYQPAVQATTDELHLEVREPQP